MKRFLTFLCALTACIPLCAGGKKDIRNADMTESPVAKAEFKPAYRKKIPDGEPVKLSEAFKAVETAKQGKETALNNATKYKNEKIPAAEAKVDQILQQAEAKKQERIKEAEGQVARFNSMYEEFVK